MVAPDQDGRTGGPLAPAPWPPPERSARITDVRTFPCAPQGCPYLIVRVETDQPGLYGPPPLDHDRWALLRGIDGSAQRP